MNARLEIEEENAFSYLQKARDFAKAHKMAKSVATLHQGLNKHPGADALWHELAKTRMHDPYHKYDSEALRSFSKAVELAPANRMYQNDYANFVGKQGGVKQAEIILLSMYDDLNPRNMQNITVLNSLGKLYAGQKRWQDAALCYGEALWIQPKEGNALKYGRKIYEERGMIYSRTGWDNFLDYRQMRLTTAYDATPRMEM